MRLTVARLALASTLLTSGTLIPAPAQAQPFDPPTDYVYGMSSIDFAIWMFERNDPFNTRQRLDFETYGVSIAVDIMTNRFYVRIQAEEEVQCADALSLAPFPAAGDGGPTCSFYSPGSNGAIAIDPIRRVMFSDGTANGDRETDTCADTLPNLEQQGQIQAFSIDVANRGVRVAQIDDPGAGHSMTDGNHLTFIPGENALWSAPSEWTDNVRPRRVDTGTVHMRGGEFGGLEVTGLPTIMPASSIGVDAVGRRIFLIPWNPPTHADPGGNTIADHPEAHYIHVYNMDTYAEVDVLDYRNPIPGDWDDNTHCGYNTDFKIYYDPIGGFLYETNFYEFRAAFYDVEAGTVQEMPFGDACSGANPGDCVLDLYGFDGPLPIDEADIDSDGDGIPTMVELGATEITLNPAWNDLDPRQRTDPDVADTDGDGLDDGAEDPNHNGRVDAGETNPFDETDNPAGDFDGDGVRNDEDNCRAIPNPGQEDEDENGRGDACDGPDTDLDGVPDDIDNCDCLPNPAQDAGDCTEDDPDGDTILEPEPDNCDCVPNPDQTDSNGDGIGDACSQDTDQDGWVDAQDNCPNVANPNQENECEADGTVGDACSPNEDGDAIPDACDNCPSVANDGQEADNCDQDEGAGDACSPDADGDGVADACDVCPDVADPDQIDLDGDGVGAACTKDTDTCACRAPGAPNGGSLPASLVTLVLGSFVAVRRRRRR